MAGEPRGLGPLDTAMNVAVPELDGRIITVPISFKETATSYSGGKNGEAPRYVPEPDRVARRRLGREDRSTGGKPNAQKRVAIILTNAPGKPRRSATLSVSTPRPR